MKKAFTLIELLVVVSIIAVLTTILLPSLSGAKQLARSSQCQANLHDLSVAMGIYHAENNATFWPYSLTNCPAPGVRCYFWGTDADPVDPNFSPFMKSCNFNLQYLWCPDLPWGSYTPQGSYVSQPTTTYAYNGRYLDKNLLGKTCKKASSIPEPAGLFVLADAALSWAPGGVTILQNSTYLEPVTGNYVQQPTNHFRHRGATNALCADGHVGNYTPEGWKLDTATNLGFVGTSNYPHYEQ
jgi:prepilin-type N-terminal cleavage/methylation domain-containing protein/prepilin-type processing-associated H-X9-DG protein